MNPFSTGRPGRIKHSWTSFPSTHASSARLQNSVPLSTVMLPGKLPRSSGTSRSTIRSSSASPPAAARSGTSAGPTAPASAAGQALKLFCHNLLQDLPIQAEIRHQPFQAPILFPQLAQLPQLIDPQPGVLFLPGIVSAFANPNFPTNIGHLIARFPLPQNCNDLLFGMSFPRHRPSPLQDCSA